MRAQWLGAPAGAMAEQSRREDPAVVEDEHVARFQALGKISEVFVVKLSAVPIQDQHAGSSAVGQRFLRDELPGKMEVEFRNQHRICLPQRTRGTQRNSGKLLYPNDHGADWGNCFDLFFSG